MATCPHLLVKTFVYNVGSAISVLLLLQFQVNMMTSNDEGSQKKMILYSSFISQPACSVRIALNLKGLDYELKPINVIKGEQFRADFVKISPMGYVPTLVDGDVVLVESLAIILYLEEKYPQHPFLPLDIKKRALNYQVANILSSSVQSKLRMPIVCYIRDNVGPAEWIPWVHKHLEK